MSEPRGGTYSADRAFRFGDLPQTIRGMNAAFNNPPPGRRGYSGLTDLGPPPQGDERLTSQACAHQWQPAGSATLPNEDGRRDTNGWSLMDRAVLVFWCPQCDALRSKDIPGPSSDDHSAYERGYAAGYDVGLSEGGANP